MNYEEPVYRPPSEANSLILQVTVGCSYNRCSFCGMYKGKTFHVRSQEDILQHIDEAAAFYPEADRIFLADGNVLCLSTTKLLNLIETIRDRFPRLRRLSLYGSPQDVLRKDVEELRLLKNAGLDLVYLGVESGSDRILTLMEKGSSREEIRQSGLMLRRSGMKLSVTLISGLGGRDLWEEHAAESASLMNAVQPEFLSLLTLMILPGTPLHSDLSEGTFTLLNPREILEETRLFISGLELENCLFRSNHASNYLPIGGSLPEEKEQILNVLNRAMEGEFRLKEETWRRL